MKQKCKVQGQRGQFQNSEAVADSWIRQKAEQKLSCQVPGCQRQLREVVSSEWGWWESEKEVPEALGSHGNKVTGKGAGKEVVENAGGCLWLGLQRIVSLQMEQGPNGSEGRILWPCGAILSYLGHGFGWPAFQPQLCHCATHKG